MENSKCICLFWSIVITVIEKLSKNILLRKQPQWNSYMHELKGYLMWRKKILLWLNEAFSQQISKLGTLLLQGCQGSIDFVLHKGFFLSHIKWTIKNKTKIENGSMGTYLGLSSQLLYETINKMNGYMRWLLLASAAIVCISFLLIPC